jgi:predicted NBD/HSP70 family sugar kinase
VKVAKPETSVGLDLGDRYIHYCVLNQAGEVIEEGRMQSSESVLRKHFAQEAVMRVAMEAGTHSHGSAGY